MTQKTFKAVDFVRRTRSEHHELLNGKPLSEVIAFYREGAKRVHELSKKKSAAPSRNSRED